MIDESIDFYKIEMIGDTKIIDPICYYYFIDDDETPGRCVWYHRYIELEKFLAMDEEEQKLWLAEIVKYIDDLTEEETEEWYEDTMKEHSVKLPFKDLTMDTPCGTYHS